MVSRADRSMFAQWWWTVDKILLICLVVLMLGGVILSLAGSPAVAERLGYDSFHFFKRHLFFLAPALVVLVGTSFLSARHARRAAIIVLGISLVLMISTLFVGSEVNGARRWISIVGFTIQPSEFMKPAFVVVVAWLFTENSRRSDIPGNLFALILLAIIVALLIAEPDFGQTMLVVVAWGALFFLAGVTWVWIAALGTVALLGIFAAYATLPHVAARIDRFVSPQSGDNYQVEKALDSIIGGGWLGHGPGEGVVKRVLPDAHTDFIFAVAAEEFGIVLSIALVMVFALVVLRGFSRSIRQVDPFVRLAAAGLVVLFGVQSVINIAVNLNLMPAKGMTLPFISYGGSSMIAVAFGMGLLLALTRSNTEPSQVLRRVDAASAPAAGHV
jgi:cell division protein FtsW